LLIAAVAERAGLIVLHYDADYDLVAAVTGQPMRRVVLRGTISKSSRVPRGADSSSPPAWHDRGLTRGPTGVCVPPLFGRLVRPLRRPHQSVASPLSDGNNRLLSGRSPVRGRPGAPSLLWWGLTQATLRTPQTPHPGHRITGGLPGWPGTGTSAHCSVAGRSSRGRVARPVRERSGPAWAHGMAAASLMMIACVQSRGPPLRDLPPASGGAPAGTHQSRHTAGGVQPGYASGYLSSWVLGSTGRPFGS
jgi:hypothetical protein